ncbi:hypothetical protein [Parasediminibacterium sp. JCM 36343]|uniref:hypothetical protein n=1 Tax=Parasediminibacterium sp. JCM 36343 TaxID=3374279 RepID=UPI00397D9BAF
METAVIHYENAGAIKLLKEMGKFMGFTVETKHKKEEASSEVSRPATITLINGIPYQAANLKADVTKLFNVFGEHNYTKQSLRDKAWKKR